MPWKLMTRALPDPLNSSFSAAISCSFCSLVFIVSPYFKSQIPTRLRAQRSRINQDARPHRRSDIDLLDVAAFRRLRLCLDNRVNQRLRVLRNLIGGEGDL